MSTRNEMHNALNTICKFKKALSHEIFINTTLLNDDGT